MKYKKIGKYFIFIGLIVAIILAFYIYSTSMNNDKLLDINKDTALVYWVEMDNHINHTINPSRFVKVTEQSHLNLVYDFIHELDTIGILSHEDSTNPLYIPLLGEQVSRSRLVVIDEKQTYQFELYGMNSSYPQGYVPLYKGYNFEDGTENFIGTFDVDNIMIDPRGTKPHKEARESLENLSKIVNELF